MANEFLIFIAAGIVIMAGMLLFFGGGFQLPGTIGTGSVENTSLAGSFAVGPSGEEVRKTLDIERFNVSNLKDTKTVTIGEREVRNGLLFGSSSIKYFLSAIDSLEIDFTVVRTNSYAPLVIRLNGKVIESKLYLPGEYKVSVGNLSQENTVEISAESSSWKIWAPTLYELSNIKFVVKSFVSEAKSFEFTVSDNEYKNFKSGRVDLILDQNIGNLIADLNGKIFYSSQLKNVQTLAFNKSSLNAGKNTILLKGSENSAFSGRADIIIIYVSDAEQMVEFPFNVTQSIYNRMKTGTVSFDVISVSKQGGVGTKIISDSVQMFSQYEKAAVGSYSYDFDKSNVRVGINKLLIQSVDKAVFNVKDIDVSFGYR